MSTVKKAPRYQTIAELLRRLGGIAARRVRADPPPGRATEKDLVALNERKGGLYELVDGTLVEKVIGYPESYLACELIKRIGAFLDLHDLGFLAGEAGAMRLMPGLVRIPDVSFVSWDRLPGRMVPRDPIAGLVPDLAVEILSESNTKGEMARKLREYLLAGVRLIWFVNGNKRTVEVFTAPDQSIVLTEDQTLDGGDVLPGLSLPLRQLFARVSPSAAASGKGKRRGSARKGRGKSRERS